MKEVRFFYVPEAQTQIELPQEEAQHAAKVLRLQPGDEVFLMDGMGTYYLAELTMVSQKHCMYNIKEVLPQQKDWNGEIHLAIAPTKNIDRIEWMVEKCTEIGWDSVRFLNCRFSERKQIRTDRIEKIVVSAAKQSHKPFMPKVGELTDFKQFVLDAEKAGTQNFICHCYNEIERHDFQNTLITHHSSLITLPCSMAIGPEGDFSIDEVRFALDHGFKSVTLGNFRLRTETAGLVAVTMAQLALRKTEINQDMI